MAGVGDIKSLSKSQKAIIQKIIANGEKRGKKAGLSRKEIDDMIDTNLAVGYTESRYSNPSGGDRDSAGYRQERAMYYDDPTNLDAAINRFYDEYLKDADRGAPLGIRAQQVQQSGTPHVWDNLSGAAARLRKQYGGSGARFRADPSGQQQSRSQLLVEPTFDQGGFAAAQTATAIGQQVAGPGLFDADLSKTSFLKDLDVSIGADSPLFRVGALSQQAPDAADFTGSRLRVIPGQENAAQGIRTNPGRYGGGPKLANTDGQTPLGLIERAMKVDRLNNKGKVPYLWGGGHGATAAQLGQAVDCSGFVSQVLGVRPDVSGGFARNWGKAGAGKNVTVYANDGHVLMSVRDPRSGRQRFFGTSKTNPGGGAGEIADPGAAYLSGFTKRHPGRAA